MVTLYSARTWVQFLALLLISETGAHGDNDQLTLQLLSRVEALEKNDMEQKATIANMQQQLVQQSLKQNEQIHIVQKQQRELINKKVNDQQTELQKKDAKLATQTNRIAVLENEVERLLTMIENDVHLNKTNKQRNGSRINSDARRDHVNKLQDKSSLKKVQAEEDPLRRRQRNSLSTDDPVAFHAIIDKDKVNHIGIDQNIKFDVVITNLGGAYHNQQGVFIAPRAGIYIFSTSILSNSLDHTLIDVDLKKNGYVLARVLAKGTDGNIDQEQGSVTVVTQLSIGDEVWVSLSYPADTSLVGQRYTSFMGCLVFPM